MNEYLKKYEELVYFRKFILPLRKWYKLNAIAQNINLPPVYTENHHIKPKSIYPDLKNDKNNIVCLTMFEHILAHNYLMLWYKDEFGKNSTLYMKMLYAYNRLIHDKENKILSINEIISLRTEYARLRSLFLKERKDQKRHVRK